MVKEPKKIKILPATILFNLYKIHDECTVCAVCAVEFERREDSTEIKFKSCKIFFFSTLKIDVEIESKKKR